MAKRLVRDKKWLFSKVKKVNACWIWQGGISSHGYATFGIRSGKSKLTTYRVHRFSYELFKGFISHGYCVGHTCSNKICVNPDHLWLGTQSEVMKNMQRNGRHYNFRKTHCINNHEFTEENTYFYPNGHRQCRACRRKQSSISKTSSLVENT